MDTTTLRGLMITLAVLLLPVTAGAQTPRSGGGTETQKIMQQYQQLAAEKTALQGQVAQMKKDLDSAQSELATVKKERDALKVQKSHSDGSSAQLAQAVSAKQSAEKSLEQLKTRTNELVVRFRETATNLRDMEASRNQLQAEAKERSTAFDKCAEANLSLYELNNEILDRYEHIGPFTKVSSAEPFTKITRTRIDNLVDEYRERALQLRASKTKQ